MILFSKKLVKITIVILLLLLPYNTFAEARKDLPGKMCVISGKVSFPKAMIAAKDSHFTLVFSKDNNQYGAGFIAAKDFKIKAGTNSVDYKLEVPANSEGYIKYCYDADENKFCYNGFYSKQGTTFAFNKATKLKLQINNKSNINLQFIKGKKLSGKVNIPYTYDNAALNYYCDIIPIYDNGTPNNLNDDVQIDQSFKNFAEFDIYNKHNKEASYSMIVPDIAASYRFLYRMEFGFPCQGGCPFIKEGYYKKSGTVYDYNNADSVMIKGTNNAPINFSILKARKMQGKIILPEGIKAEPEIGIMVLGDDSDRETYVSFHEGTNSAEFTLYFQDWRRKHVIMVGRNTLYYVSKNTIVKDKASAELFDLSKGNLNDINVYLTKDIFN